MKRLDSKPSVQLHIERLVIDAPLTARADADSLQQAIEVELTRLLREEGLNVGSDAMARIEASPIQATGLIQPARFGREIARSIHHAVQLNQGANPENREVQG